MNRAYLSPEESRRLTSALLTVVAAIALLALFLVIVVPGLRGAAPAPAAGVAATPSRTGWLDPTDYPPMKGYTVPPVDPAALIAGGPQLLERGRALYAENCVACHGAAGRGDGPAAANLVPRPRDFTSPEGWKNGPGLDGIFTTLERGIPGSAMAPYDQLSKTDRMALAHAVKGFGNFAGAAEDPAALPVLAQRLANGAETVPAKIPVKRAIALLVAEYRAGRTSAVDLGAPKE